MVQKILDKVLNACCADGLPFGKQDEEPEQEVTAATKTAAPATKSRAVIKPVKSAGQFTGKQTKYLDYKHKDAPAKVQKAIITLGFTESDWPNAWPESENMWFEDLTEEQQEAAKTLGFDATSWNTFYEGKSWSELPEGVKKAAKVAGFTMETWESQDWPESTDKSWDDLDEDVQKAMMVFGYSKNWW